MVYNKNRLLVGIILISIIFLFYYFSLDKLFIIIFLPLVIYDLYSSKLLNLNQLYVFIVILTTFIILHFYFFNYFLIMTLIACLSVVLSIFLKKFLKIFFIFYIIGFVIILINLNHIDRNIIYIVIILSFFNDTIAYIFGNLFRGPLIAPKISPKKTWSGTISSFCITFSTLIFFDYNYFFAIFFSSSLFFGDLYFSYIKRKIQIKDFSKILFSHGGILDRVDSISFGLIIYSIYTPIHKSIIN